MDEEKRPLTEREQGIQQVPFRLHVNDHALLMKVLKDDEMRFQYLVSACIEAYLRGDPGIRKIVREWKAMNALTRSIRDSRNIGLSQRERQALLDELEKEEPGA